jgi:hypothetical protein
MRRFAFECRDLFEEVFFLPVELGGAGVQFAI